MTPEQLLKETPRETAKAVAREIADQAKLFASDVWNDGVVDGIDAAREFAGDMADDAKEIGKAAKDLPRRFMNLFHSPTLEELRHAAFGGGAMAVGTHVMPLLPPEKAVKKYLAKLPTATPEEQAAEGVILTDIANRTRDRMRERGGRMSQAALGGAYNTFDNANQGLAALGLPTIELFPQRPAPVPPRSHQTY